MNTLEDLRATLDRQAATVHDDSAHARVVAVRGRAVRHRRQRAAATLVAAALAVGGISAATLMGGDAAKPKPAERPVVDGHRAPATIESLGSTYAYDHSVRGTERLTVDLSASDEPRLVTWAGEGRLRVNRQSDAAAPTPTTGEFDDFTLVYPGADHGVTVRGDGDLVASVYTLNERAPGDYDGQIAFPDQVDAQRRVDSVIGETGQVELKATIPMPDSAMTLRTVCTSAQRGLMVRLSFDDGGFVGSGCQADTGGGLVSGNGAVTPSRRGLPEAGQPVDLRLWVVDRATGDPVEPGDVPDLQLALAAYAEQQPVTRVPGWSVPRVIDSDGHRWEYARHVTGSGDLSLAPDEQAPYLVTALIDGEARTPSRYVRMRQDGRVVQTLELGSSISDAAHIYDDKRHTFKLTGPADVAVTMAVYRRVD